MDIVHRHDTTLRSRPNSVIPAGEFKQRCLALIDQVAAERTSILVTKRGRPLARLVPVDEPVAPLEGSVSVITEHEEELFSTGEPFELDSEK
ncbi:MAG: type II toxin-antitoxin system Phd/YefM family antitoxin [Acidimicrobiales bacterium]